MTNPLDERKPLIVRKRGGGERVIPAGRWWINRNTPVGEDAQFWEIKPYNGRREILRREILGQPEARDD